MSFGEGDAGVLSLGLAVEVVEGEDGGRSATAAVSIREIFCRISEFIVLGLKWSHSHRTRGLINEIGLIIS